MLLAYIATALLLCRRWRAAVVMFSAATSIKMNILLMAPSVLVILLKVGPSTLSDSSQNMRSLCHSIFASCQDCALIQDVRIKSYLLVFHACTDWEVPYKMGARDLCSGLAGGSSERHYAGHSCGHTSAGTSGGSLPAARTWQLPAEGV